MYDGPPEEYLPYKINGHPRMIPPMFHAGQGARFHTTGLTHDERGYPDMTPACQKVLVNRLVDKIQKNRDDIIHIEEEETEGCEVLVLSYGISSRVTTRGVAIAREKGIKVGHLVMKIVWPFPEKRVRELAEKVKGLVMVEMNLGQMVHEAERIVAGRCSVHLAGHAGGTVHEPETIAKLIEEAAR